MSDSGQNEKSSSAVKDKVAIGTVSVAVIGLLTAFLNNGGLSFLQALMASPTSATPTATTAADPSVAASPVTASMTSTPAQTAAPQPVAAVPQVEAAAPESGFTFAYQGCDAQKKSIVCTVLITHPNAVSGLTLVASGGSQLVLPTGRAVSAKRVQMGDRDDAEAVSADLAPGVPLKAEVTFSGVPRLGDRPAVLELALQRDNQSFTVQFPDVMLNTKSDRARDNDDDNDD